MSRPLAVQVLVVLLVSHLTPCVCAVDDMAGLMPEEVVAYAEIRSTERVLSLLEGWSSQAGVEESPVEALLADMGRDLGLEPAEMRTELKKVRRLAFAVTRIDPVVEEPIVLYMADLGEAERLGEVLFEQLKKLGDQPAAVVRDVPVYGDEDGSFGCIAGNHLIAGASLDDVKAAVERLKGAGTPSLGGSARFRRAVAAADPKCPALAWVDVRRLHRHIKEGAAADDMAAIETLFDLGTVDGMVFSVSSKNEATLLDVSVLFRAENRAFESLRTVASQRALTRFFPPSYALLHTGTLADGKVQWENLKGLIVRLEALDGEGKSEFLAGVGELETALGIKLADELGNVTDYAVGMRVRRGAERPQPDFLIVLEMKDAERAAGVMTKVEEAAQEEPDNLEVGEKDVEGVKVRFVKAPDAASDYAYALTGNTLLLGNHAEAVAEAVRTSRQNKCILDEPGVKKMLARLHAPHSKLLLISPAMLASQLPRNPHAPPPAVLGLTTVEQPLRLDIRLDCTELGGLMRSFAVMLRLHLFL